MSMWDKIEELYEEIAFNDASDAPDSENQEELAEVEDDFENLND